MKPKLSFAFYPKLGRGFWMVSPIPKRWKTLTPEERRRWYVAHVIARDMNRNLVHEGKVRP